MAQLPDESIQLYLEEIARLGKIAARLKARERAMEENRKITKATLMKMARATGEATSRDSAETWAYTHPQYKIASDSLIAAIEDAANAETDSQNAIREWESWRTLCANERSIR